MLSYPPIHIVIDLVYINAYVRPVNTKNVSIVPNIPNNRMYPRLSKNLLLLMLKPDAKIIGGKQT